MTAPATGGTYILLVELSVPTTIEVGKLGKPAFDAGIYAYIGSALGPGGLASRLRRYEGRPTRTHWHIDYLLAAAEIIGALYRTDEGRHECAWASWVGNRAQNSVPGFGSSDCRCTSHLFFLGDNAGVEEIIRSAGCELKASFSIGGL